MVRLAGKVQNVQNFGSALYSELPLIRSPGNSNSRSFRMYCLHPNGFKYSILIPFDLKPSNLDSIAPLCNAWTFLHRKFRYRLVPGVQPLQVAPLASRHWTVNFLQTLAPTGRFRGMACNYTGPNTKLTKNPVRISKDPIAVKLDEFLQEFAGLPRDSNQQTMAERGDAMRTQLDDITKRIRRDSQPAVPNEAGEIPVDAQPHSPTGPLHAEIPVRDRLDTMELMLKEIRDSMKNQAKQPAELGQVQPRGAPAGIPPPANGRQRNRSSRAGNGGPADNVAPGLAQPRGRPLGNPMPANDRYSGDSSDQASGIDHSRADYYHSRPLTQRHRDTINQNGEPRRRTRPVARTAHRQPRHAHQLPAPGTARPHRHTGLHDGGSRRPPKQAHRGAHKRTHPSPAHQETSSSTETETETEDEAQRHHSDHTDRRLMDHALQRQYQHMGQSSGRNNDILPPLVRPHEALPPDMKRRVRERTGKKNRKDLTFHEYVCGYARMILTELDPHTDIYAMINHLSQIAQDAAASPWPSVRTWTTTCLDYIQEDQAAWTDTSLFTDERNRIAWSHGRFDATTPVPCPAFNNDSCKQTPPHYDGDLRFIHTCAICYYAAPSTNRVESTTHSAKTCNRRRRAGGREDWDSGNGSNGRHGFKRHSHAGASMGAVKKDANDNKAKN